MKFKNNKQRRAIMAKLSKGDTVIVNLMTLKGTYEGENSRGSIVKIRGKDNKPMKIVTRKKIYKIKKVRNK